MKKNLLIPMSLLLLLMLAACSTPAAQATLTPEPTATVCSEDSEICPVGPDIAPTATQVPAIPAATSGDHHLIANGSGQVYITPDMAYIYIGVNNQSEVLADAMDENSALSEAIMTAITGLGVGEEDIQTSNINVYPQTQYDSMGEVTGTSFNVENTVYVSVRDLKNLNDVIEASLEAGANSVNGIQMDVSDKSAALAEAQKLAIENAKAQAETLAQLTGVELGDLANVSISSSGLAGAQTAYGFGGGGAGMMNLNTIPVSAGQMSIAVEATLIYDIK